MVRPKYFFSETFTSFKRNFLMGFTAITTVAITLFIVGFFSVLVFDIQSIINSIKGQVELAVYLQDNISPQLNEYIESEINSWEETNEIKYISKEQALERFKEQNEGSDILKEIQGNPLPASFEITLNDPEKVELVALRFLDKDGNYIEGIDDVVYGQTYVRRLFSIRSDETCWCVQLVCPDTIPFRRFFRRFYGKCSISSSIVPAGKFSPYQGRTGNSRYHEDKGTCHTWKWKYYNIYIYRIDSPGRIAGIDQ